MTEYKCPICNNSLDYDDHEIFICTSCDEKFYDDEVYDPEEEDPTEIKVDIESGMDELIKLINSSSNTAEITLQVKFLEDFCSKLLTAMGYKFCNCKNKE